MEVTSGKYLVVKWRVQIPENTRSYWSKSSQPFCWRKGQWRLKCDYDDSDDLITLNLIPVCGSFPSAEAIETPNRVSVKVECRSGTGLVMDKLTGYDPDWEEGSEIIYQPISKLVRVLPGFSRDRELTFKVTIQEEDPQTETSTTDDHRKGSISRSSNQGISTATASVQTSLHMSTFPCLVSLSEDLAKLLDLQESDPDVEFQCADLKIKAHRTVVSSRSPVLAKMLKSDMVEGRTGVAKIQDMSADTFKQFLRYLYTGQLEELTFDSAVALFEAGDQFEVGGLASRCSEFIVRNLSEANAYDVLVVADAHSDSKLVEAIVCFMVKGKFPISSDHWSKFSDDQPKLATKVLNQFCQKFAKKWMERED